jgi:DNA-binding MarR family transcriptional regulator
MARRSRDAAHDLFTLTRILSTVVANSLEPFLIERAGGKRISPPQLKILRLLTLNGTHALREIAFFAGVSLPAASYIVDRLVKMGFVTRDESPEDRRLLRIDATARGRELVRRHDGLCADAVADFAGLASPQEMAVFSEVARKLIRAVVSKARFKRRHCLQCGAYQKGGCLAADIKGICDYLPARAAARQKVTCHE